MNNSCKAHVLIYNTTKVHLRLTLCGVCMQKLEQYNAREPPSIQHVQYHRSLNKCLQFVDRTYTNMKYSVSLYISFPTGEGMLFY